MARLETTIQERTNSLPVKLTLLLVSTLTVMAGATIAPSLPAMREHFAEVSSADYLVRLALTLPALFIALGAPFVGVAIDRLGRKPLLLFSLVLYGIAGSSGFVLSTLGLILVGRAFLGISVAGIMTTATTLIADYYSGSARAQFLGLQAGFMGLGGVLFLSLGGFLADGNWRSPFLIYVMALVLVPFTATFLPEPQRNQPTLTSSNATDTAQKFPLNLVVLTYGIALITQIVFYLIPTQLPFYLQQIANASPSQSGLAIALSTLFSATSSILYRQVKARLGFIAIYGIAFVNMALGYGLIGWAIGYAVVLVGLAIAGIGLGLLMPNMNLCLTSVTPDAFRGRVLSGITTSFFLGQFLSPLLSQPISYAVGLGTTYGLAAGLMLILTGFALVLFWRWR
ncbi:MFS transporter [Fischerella sp. PCC 9605]|uniref:MFS transporter n=1 Tax=Fischerella sp. PCC 9605 TaxID=1173024 RepID=UPI00047AA78E|nr:MFS transporter [Fischerella sp. PCC 9605]